MTQSPYEIAHPETIPSPALVIFLDLVERNLERMISMVDGDLERLRPHVKTHKMRQVIDLQQKAGIRKFKCATIAEAEMVASCGAPDVLLAYQMVGPNRQRFANLMRHYRETTFSSLVDCPKIASELSEVARSNDLQFRLLLDIDTGQNRTGVPVGAAAEQVYADVDSSEHLLPAGFHIYDGQNKHPSLADRTAAIRDQLSEVMSLKAKLEENGMAVPTLVCGGTPTFPVYAQIQGVECSPGTCVFHDAGYGSKFEDLRFTKAAMLLTRVISKTGTNRLCLDLGYKAVASDPVGDRVVLPTIPDAKQLLQNEEHLLIETETAKEYEVGDCLLAFPIHICPTSALHQKAHIIRDGEIVDTWEVAARDRFLTI